MRRPHCVILPLTASNRYRLFENERIFGIDEILDGGAGLLRTIPWLNGAFILPIDTTMRLPARHFEEYGVSATSDSIILLPLRKEILLAIGSRDKHDASFDAVAVRYGVFDRGYVTDFFLRYPKNDDFC